MRRDKDMSWRVQDQGGEEMHTERWGARVEYHFQEFNEPYAPSKMLLNDGA